VVFPEGPSETASYELRGIPLAATETVAVLVSTELAPIEPTKGGGILSSPLASPASVANAFMKGFRAARQDAKIELADEPLRNACFDKGTKSVLAPGRPMLVMPALDAPDCRALVETRGIRYLVSLSGNKWTYPSTVEPVQLSFLGSQTQSFDVISRAIDARSGAVACEESYYVTATWHGGVIWIYIPVPYFQFVDDSAHWERAAWHTGRSCPLTWCTSRGSRKARNVAQLITAESLAG
jgi:hypothetical protein